MTKRLFISGFLALFLISCHPHPGDQPEKIIIQNSTGEWEEITYTYNAENNLSMEYHEHSDGEWYTVSYYYDQKNRITNIHRGYPWGTGQYRYFAYYTNGNIAGEYHQDSDGKISKIIYNQNGDIISYVYRLDNWGWISNSVVYSNDRKQYDIYLESTGISEISGYKYSSSGQLLASLTTNSFGDYQRNKYYYSFEDNLMKKYSETNGIWEVTYYQYNHDHLLTEVYYENSEEYIYKEFYEYEGTNLIKIYYEDITNYLRWETYDYDKHQRLKKKVVKDDTGAQTIYKFSYYLDDSIKWELTKENTGYRKLSIYSRYGDLVSVKFRYANGMRKNIFYAYHSPGQLRYYRWRDSSGNYQFYKYKYPKQKWKKLS